MILVLSDSCPIFRAEAERHLQSLLYTITVRQHHILARPEPSRLKELLPKHLWDIYGVYLSQAPKQVVNSYQNWVHSADCTSCDAAKLAHFCELPTVLIVENATTDGGWIKLIIAKLRPRLAAHMREPHVGLEIHQAGGVGEIPKELERIAQRYLRARTAETLPLRVVALADSDSKTPGHPSTDARQVASTAARCGAEAHILMKRSIENYIPDKSLQEYAVRRPHCRTAVEFVTRLANPARDHYPLKDGLSRDEIDASGSMYPPGTPLELKVGNFIADLLENFAWLIDGRELKERDGVNELDTLLDLLEANL